MPPSGIPPASQAEVLLSRAETIFDVSRWRGRLGALAPTLVCCRNACSQLHPRCNRFNSYVGECRSSHPCRSILRRSVYSGQLLRLCPDTGFYGSAQARARSFSICLLTLCHRRSFPFGTGSIFARFPSIRPSAHCPLRLQVSLLPATNTSAIISLLRVVPGIQHLINEGWSRMARKSHLRCAPFGLMHFDRGLYCLHKDSMTPGGSDGDRSFSDASQ